MVGSNLIKQLQERGLVAKITNEEGLTKRLIKAPISLYCGFDPTADSLHVGHLVVVVCLKHFQKAGNFPVVLVGGATALIGDPSFKGIERKLNTIDTVQDWAKKIKQQISLFLGGNYNGRRLLIANNNDWFSTMNTLTFFREIGKYFSINQMVNKEAIKQRIHRVNSGISFTEFSYNLLQAYDFACLNKQYGVALQIGGSDQWGNITSGINLTRRMHKNTVYGLTVPLITKPDGTKFGKTESGTVWLDPTKTSPYKFYQFWINTADHDVYRFLKFFTFMPLVDIQVLEKEDRDSGRAPRAQHILAQAMTRMVHGEQGLAAAERITLNLFTGELKDLMEDDFTQLALDGMPTVILDRTVDLQEALVAGDLVVSRGQAKSMIASNAIVINGEKQVSVKYMFKEEDRLYGRYTLLRRGKKNYCLLHWK